MTSKLAQHYWDEYVMNGSYDIHGDAPGPMEFDIMARDRRKFPELKGYKTYRLVRFADGKMRGRKIKAGFSPLSYLKFREKYKYLEEKGT